ncbi:AraC family transcriptional regulator [Microbulbifer sp. OS29]|uniref:AraC family transcriptional regulator n=1 Tax=Microbulbifer okhotskensis TaxID=2926617 RepID=A0A9X2ETM7_9GAMM|nr:AraC family transcriptional regulator [Microbulbifer okhotskensis]MCO1335571.1 AraC family transcriptional regulator [Microbulbifer okhotskensis]
MTQQIRAKLLTGFYDQVSELNGCPETLLNSAGINPEQVEKLEGYLPLGKVTDLVEKAARQLNCADFGLRLAQSQGSAALSSLGAAVLQSLTLGEFLNAAVKQFAAPPYNLRVELEVKGLQTLITFHCLNDLESYIATESPLPLELFREFLLGVSVVALQILCGEKFHLEAVHLKSARPLHGQYEKFFNASVHFAQTSDALILSSSQLAQPTEKCNPVLRPLLKSYIGKVLEHGEASLVYQVEQLVYCLMPLKRCSLQEVANQLGMHKRTLQRRLRDQELVFEDILDRIRRERAEYYLSRKLPPMAQISSMLGYREQSSFNRACDRWFSATPMKVRRRLLNEAAAKAVLETD